MKIGTKFTAAIVGSMMLASSLVQAADWQPDGDIRLQIGFGAGGSTDVMGRVLAKTIEEQTGWNVIAENKTGGGGMAMFTVISKMPKNNNIVGLGVNMPVMINLVKRPDDVAFNLDSFDYLGTMARAQLALISRADAPFNTLAEMVAYSKANDGVAVGFGAAPQKLLMEVVNKQDDAGFRFVSTKGEAETQKLLLGGQILAGFSAGTHVPYLKSGDFKMIAVGNNARHNYAPETQSFVEQGYNAYVDPYWFMAMTAGTDPAATKAITAAVAAAVNSDAVAEIVANAASSAPLNLGPEGTKKMLVDGIENVKVLFGQ